MRFWTTAPRAVRVGLRAVLVATVASWTFDVPGRLALALYTEQFLALVIGLCTAIVLLEGAEFKPALVRAADSLLAALVLALFVYVAVNYPSMQLSLALAPPAAVALGVIMIAGVLEATRRKTGPFLPILVLLLIGFAFVGPHLPDIFKTRPVTFSRLVVYLGLDTNALFGKVMAIASIVVIPFIVFGHLLNAFGGSGFFARLAAASVGRFRGGPAKVSVVGSAVFGMVSGSAVANVASVGSVSIPMMARAGYQRHVAAAIEAVSSTGGQLMPPIMGASAFLMAELLELPYRSVVVAAILPALFFYLALFLAVDLEARRMGIGAVSPEDRVGEDTRIRGWRFLIPIAVLLYLLFIEKRTAEYAGVYSVVALIAVHLTFPFRDFPGRARQVVSALLQAMTGVTDIIMIAASAGLIIGVLNITGISFAITLQMLAISQNSLALLLVLTAGLSILLGLGMPTVGVYILLATLAAPALVELGVPVLAAHFYVLYFGMLSMITPPIAIASFAAATVANTNPWTTSFASVRLGAAVFLVPVAFVLQPELLLLGGVAETLLAAARLTLAVIIFTAVTTGYTTRPLNLTQRIIGGAVALINVLPFGGTSADMVLWAALAAGLCLVVFAVRTAGSAADPIAAEPRDG
ncbi:MAG: TRAP transporter permease [Hyphomicrobiales bacterium]